MEITESLYVTERKHWRNWLEINHKTKTEIWLIYFKKHTGRPRIPYDDAVEEALCYGWIDSTVKRIDDETYAQKFTPRKIKSQWSDLNINRARKMIELQKMTQAGLDKFDLELLNKTPASRKKEDLTLPDEFRIILEKNKKAWNFFLGLAPSYQRHYIGWVTSAKREETRQRRMSESLSYLEQNKKLPMK